MLNAVNQIQLAYSFQYTYNDAFFTTMALKLRLGF